MHVADLETEDDRKWLKEVHGIDSAGYAKAILTGNEDSPTKVELYARDHYQCPPKTYEPNDEGVLVVTQEGEAPSV